MSMISEHLKAEVIDPSLPRDSFTPPDWDDEDEDGIDGDEALDFPNNYEGNGDVE